MVGIVAILAVGLVLLGLLIGLAVALLSGSKKDSQR